MTDWREAGRKADASRVAKMARGTFQGKSKKLIRDWVIAEIADAQPDMVLDLWGGGESADAMVSAGLKVVSVDNGTYLKSLGVSASRAKRSLSMSAASGGYEWDWGPKSSAIVRNAPRCQAAFLDFMGPLSMSCIEALHACRDMDVVAVTLMPERVTGMERVPVDIWRVMYQAAIRELVGMGGRPIWRRYRRPEGHWVFVFLFRSGTRVGHPTRSQQLRSLRADPVKAEAIRAADRAAKATAAIRAKDADRKRVLRSDPVKAEHVRQLARESNRRRIADPAYRAMVNERAREADRKRRMDPAYRDRQKVRHQEWRAIRRMQGKVPS